MEINRNTYEEFFLLYVDGELSRDERKAIEEFANRHPDLREELEILKTSVLLPDNDIVFANKEELYKEEDERKVVPFRWWRAAAAVLLIGFGTFGWLYLDNEPAKQQPPRITEINNKTTEPVIQKTTDIKHEPAIVAPEIKKPANTKPRINKPETIKAEVAEPEETNNNREPLNNNIDITAIGELKEDIEVKVAPRKLDEEINSVVVNASYSQPEVIDQSADNDMIYFANTSFSKRNKLRGVFRKATRIIDKVTSLQ
jgi:hypothetical protein